MIWLVILVALMIPLVAVQLDSNVGRALANRLERGSTPALPDATVGNRINQMEAEIERLNSEVQRLDEETTFLHRLLENKPASQGKLPPGEHEA